MAEYQRRRTLYEAERADRRAKAGLVAAGAVAVVVVVVELVAAALGAGTGTMVRYGVGSALVVLLAVAAWFYRVPPEIEAWRRDALAERRTARALDRLSRAGFTVLHDRSTAESAGNIDHLIIGASGVWVVETDSHKGPVRASGAAIWVGKAPLRARLGLVAWTGEQVSAALLAELPDGWQMQAQTMIAFDRAEVPGELALVDGVLLLPAKGVAEYVLSAGVVLRPLDVAMLVNAAQRVLPAYEPIGSPKSSARAKLRSLTRRDRI
jgi:hypothetical protein